MERSCVTGGFGPCFFSYPLLATKQTATNVQHGPHPARGSVHNRRARVGRGRRVAAAERLPGRHAATAYIGNTTVTSARIVFSLYRITRSMPRSRARRSRARRSSRRSGRRRQPRSGSRYRGPGEMTTFGPFILNEQNSTEDVTKRLENLKQEIAELSEMSPHNAEAIAEMVTTMKLFPSIMNGNKVEMIKIEAIDQTGKVTQEEYIRLFFMNHVAVNTLLIKWTRQTTNYFHKILQTFQQLMISYMGHYQFFGCRETVSFLDDFLLNFIRIDERDRSVDVKGFADFLEFIDIGLDTGLQTYFTTKMQISLVRLVEEEQLNNKRKADCGKKI